MALTKVTGEFIDIGDIDISDVGTISLDAIQGDADANTSITFSGSDVITIATGGSGRLTIGDGALSPVTNNQIDLGTASLEFKNAFFDGTVTADAFAGPLTGDVTGNVSGTAATVTTAAQSAITSVGTLTGLTIGSASGATITMNDTDTNQEDFAFVLGANALAMRKTSNSNDIMRLDLTNERVGIGTASPSANLHIYSTADNAPHLLLENFQNADTDDAPVIELYLNDQTTGGIGDNTDVGVIRFTGDEKDGGTKETYAEIRGVAHDPGSGTGNKGNLSFFVQSAGSLAETMTLDENRVGIGTASPARNLVVSSSGQTDLAIVAGTSASAQLQFGDSGDDNIGQIEYNNSTNNMMFYANATEHMRINSNGNINIGIGGSGGDLLLQPLAKLYLDAGGNTYIQESAGDVIDIYTGGTRRLRINSNGLLFNADTAAANALDDYEEGTWTPTYTVDGGGSAGTVTSTNVGTYTKIGNLVHCAVRSFYVPTSGTVPTAYNISLPFQAKNNGGLAGYGVGREIAQNGKSLFIEVDGNQTAGKIKCKDGSAPPANAYIDLSFTYQAA